MHRSAELIKDAPPPKKTAFIYLFSVYFISSWKVLSFSPSRHQKKNASSNKKHSFKPVWAQRSPPLNFPAPTFWKQPWQTCFLARRLFFCACGSWHISQIRRSGKRPALSHPCSPCQHKWRRLPYLQVLLLVCSFSWSFLRAPSSPPRPPHLLTTTTPNHLMCVGALQAETSAHNVPPLAPFQFLANSESSRANGAIGSLTEHMSAAR